MALVQPKKRNRNICSYLLQRAHNGPCPRKDLRVLRRLLEKQTSRFVQVWRKDSKHPIGYESGHLFFDHFKTCYSVWGTREKPVRLAYKHPPGRPADKIESALVFESPIDQESFQKCCPGDQGFNGHRSCLIGVTSDGWLVRRCLYTGRLLERVFISRSIRFKRVLWETDLERVVVKSVHLRSRSQNMASTIRPEHLAPSPVLYLALFQVAPLTFVAIIPIERAIFGHGVVDATLSMGLLSVMHQSGKMRFYGLDSILSENTFSPTNPSSGQVNSFSKHHIGGYPHGPVNVAFKAHPQVLFECSSYQHAISFGGYPWHFIACPQMQHNVFHVMSVEDKELVKGGVLQSDAPSLELDQAYFHGDRSGRLLHVGPHSVRWDLGGNMIGKLSTSCTFHSFWVKGFSKPQQVIGIPPHQMLCYFCLPVAWSSCLMDRVSR